jgi:hypothetical protein
MRASPRAARVLLAILSTLAALALAEIAARVVERPPPPIAATSNQYEFYRFDPLLGWANAPRSSGTFAREEFSHPVAINEHGMRYRAVDKRRRPGVRRVAVLGDSFTWGLGVDERDRFTERAEARLAGKVELLNFGVSGYAPVQYRLMLDEVLAFEPEVVVIVFCLANDYLDDVLYRRYGYYKPYAELDDRGGVTITGYPLPNVGTLARTARRDSALSRFLDRRSALFRRLEPLARRTSASAEMPQRGITSIDEWERELYADPATLDAEKRAAVEKVLAIDRLLLREIAARVARAGARLVILPAPTKCELGRCFGGDGTPNLRVYRELEATARAIGAGFVDTSATLGTEDFWEKDTHWRASGHRKIAEVLARYLEGHSL